MASELPDEPAVDASKAEWAAYLADLGRQTRAFKVFQCTPDGKGPFNGVRWKGAAIWDRKSVEALWADHPDCNIGMAIQPGFVALDADVYKPEHAARLAMFEAKHGKLPETMEFSSARGGRHLIYSTERNLGNGLGSLPDFGDVRGHGGYLVGPGSTFEGKRYTIVDPGVPEALPKAVDACLVERREAAKSERTLPPTKMLDDPLNVARFTAWLLKDARPSIEGHGGNNNLAAAAAMGSSYGLSADRTVELLLEHFNPRCVPPWDDSDVEFFGGSGYRSAQNFGNLAEHNPALMFKAQKEEGIKLGSPHGDQIFFTMSDIPGEPPPRQWAIGDDSDGWVPLGDITTLYGPGGVGKTTLAGQMALAVARGEPLFGLIPVRKMPVLLLACEDPADELHRRFEKQGRRADDNVTFAALFGKDNALHPPFKGGQLGEDTWLYRTVAHHLALMPAGDKLVTIDNLAQVFHGNYYEPADIARFLNGYLRRLLLASSATMLLLAHPSENQKASGDGSFGGVGWSGGVRSRLYFDRHMTRPLKKGDKPRPIGEQRVFSRKKANYGRAHGDGEGLVLDWRDWNFVPVVQAPKAPEGFKPVGETAAPAERASEAAVLNIVQEAVEKVLTGNPSKSFNATQLATDVSHLLGQQGHDLAMQTIRRHHIPLLVAKGHPYYDRLSTKAHWRARQTLH